MKKIIVLINFILFFASCEDSLKQKAEEVIISKINNPKSYEFANLILIDSISNHKDYEEKIDSLTKEINTNSFRLLNVLFDIKHQKEKLEIDSLSKKIRSMKRELIRSKESYYMSNYKKIKAKEIYYKKLQNKYDYKKEQEYFGLLNYSMALDENTIVWDSLIKMDKNELNHYFKEAQPSLSLLYGIKKNDSVIKTFKFVDSIQKLLKNTKPVTNFYIYEFSFREKNNFNATILSKMKIKTLVNKKDIIKIYK